MPEITVKIPQRGLQARANIDPEEFLDACTAEELLQIYFTIQESLYQNKMTDYLNHKIDQDAGSGN